MTCYSQALATPVTAYTSNPRLVREGFKVFIELKFASGHIVKQETGFNPKAVDGVINDQTILL